MKASFFQQHYFLNVRFSSETIVYSFVSILITADPDWAKILDPDRVLSWELPSVPGCRILAQVHEEPGPQPRVSNPSGQLLVS